MSNKSIREYISLLRQRYQSGNWKLKHLVLDELCRNLGYHRKSAIRSLNQKPRKGKKRGRKKIYKGECVPHLRRLWKLMGFLGPKHMKAALPFWIEFYRFEGFTPEIKAQILAMSASTIDRTLKPYRARLRRKHLTGTLPGRLLKNIIPIKPLDWNVTEPGHVEADTVAHCGGSMSGVFAWSLTVTDIHLTWTENRAMWGKSGKGVVECIEDMEDNIPFSILSFSVDNGNEFLNHQLVFKYTHPDKRNPNIYRGRPYRKNDQCHVEQKNYTHVRELFGYERYDRKELVDLMNSIYRNQWSRLQNFFIPQVKLIRKTRIGSKYKREYSKPMTPYQRVLECPTIPALTKQKLREFHKTLNPIEIKQQLQRKLRDFNLMLRSTEELRRAA